MWCYNLCLLWWRYSHAVATWVMGQHFVARTDDSAVMTHHTLTLMTHHTHTLMTHHPHTLMHHHTHTPLMNQHTHPDDSSLGSQHTLSR